MTQKQKTPLAGGASQSTLKDKTKNSNGHINTTVRLGKHRKDAAWLFDESEISSLPGKAPKGTFPPHHNSQSPRTLRDLVRQVVSRDKQPGRESGNRKATLVRIQRPLEIPERSRTGSYVLPKLAEVSK